MKPGVPPPRQIEAPLGADAHDRPTLAQVAELWSRALTKPIPPYRIDELRRWLPKVKP